MTVQLRALILLGPLLIWIGAPLVHLVHEHGEEDGDHHFCTLFHDLSHQLQDEAPTSGPSYTLLEAMIEESILTPKDDFSCSPSIRAPPAPA